MMSLKIFWRSSRRRWLGLPLMAGLATFLLSPAARSHDVPGGHERHASGESAVQVDDVRRLLAEFRMSGDDTYLDRAWATIEPELHANPHDVDVLIDAALVAQARHFFERALLLTRKALTFRRDNDQAWLLLAAIHLVRGETAEAGEACRQLRHTAMLVIMTCHARVAHASGDSMQAKLQLDRMLAVIDTSRTPSEWYAWALSVAADLAASAGQYQQAVDYYSRSLAQLESAQVRAALVDVLLAHDQLLKASDVLDAGSGALPLDIRRFIVAKRLGRTDMMAGAIARADHAFRHWMAEEDWLHAREMARFYLDVIVRPELARRLATINLELQKEPEDRRLAARARGVEDA